MRTAFGAEFDLSAGYLNTPSIGIPPRLVADAVASAVGRWRTGADTANGFDADIATARRGFADLVGVDAAHVAIGSTVAQLVGTVAAGLPDGARVLALRGDFTSVTFPFAAHAERGVTVTEVSQYDLPSTVDGHDLVALSVVQSADGTVVDLDALREACTAASVPVLLDVTQAAGWWPLRLDWADWVVGAGYKWLMSPRGAAWLAVHPRALPHTVSLAANWYAGEDPWQSIYGLPLRLAGGARRLDLSPVWLAQVGAAAALPYVAGLDPDQVRKHCAGLGDLLRERLGLQPAGSAIVSIAADNAAQRLAEAGVTASVRAGRARVGFHVYNTEEDVGRVVDALSR